MSHIFRPFRISARGQKRFLTGASCLLLAGCSSVFAPQNALTDEENKRPQRQVADYLATDCADVWSLQGSEIEKNPLYWLRGIDCAGRLSPEMARSEARQHNEQHWQDAFRRGILLARARITPVERRDILSLLDSFSPQIPFQVRPLFQLWREGQALQLTLSEERMRYSRLQQSTDGELDALRAQQQQLRNQLDITTRKLENLTDIERQLSSRKPASSNFTPDATSGSEQPSSGQETTPPAGEEKK